MLRLAGPADLPQLLVIRDAAGADALTDPALINRDELARLIAGAGVFVWEEGGRVEGFAAADGESGKIAALLLTSAARGKGVGRALLAAACVLLKRAGHPAATLTVVRGSDSERHYRAAGWADFGSSPTGGLVLKKPL